LAAVSVREVLYRLFNNPKEVATHTGLTLSPFASGDRHREYGISKAGDSLLRKSMVEFA
jgi:transposase